jgi:nucleoside-diphosphate-sugar epimerase
MNILITGSTGFVGKNLILHLTAKGFTEIDKPDLRKTGELRISNDTAAVIHLAGKAHDIKKSADPDEYYRVNFELTKKLYDTFLKSSAEKFIFVSSVKAVADTVEGELTERAIPNPETDYGKSKLMAEQYIQSQPIPEGKRYYILRPCMIHGPYNKGNLNLLYEFVKKGIPYPLAGFNNKRSFLSIGNLCYVINELIIRDNIPTGIYQVSDDEAFSTSELVTVLAQSLNKKPALWKISSGLIKSIAKLGDILHLPLTTERLNKLTESYIVSNKKIKQALNTEFPISALEGLKITAESFNSKEVV